MKEKMVVDQVIEPELKPELKTSKPKPKWFWLAVFGSGMVVGMVILWANLVYFREIRMTPLPSYVQIVEPTTKVDLIQTPIITSIPREKITLNLGGLIWLDLAQKVSGEGIFKLTKDPNGDGYYSGNFAANNIVYRKVGSWSDGSSLVYAQVDRPGPGGGSMEVIKMVQTASKDWVYLESYQEVIDRPNVIQALHPQVKLSDSVITETMVPAKLIVNGQILTKRFENGNFFDELIEPVLIDTVTEGKVYKTIPTLSLTNLLISKGFYLRLPDNRIVSYAYKVPFMSDDSVPMITWFDGTKNTEIFSQAFAYGGCGGSGWSLSGIDRYVANPTVVADRRIVGKTNGGDDVYKLESANNELIKYLYEKEYLSGRDPESAETLTQEKYAQAKTYFLWKDPWGNWEVYTNQNYGRLAECGKPVIYLYPEKTTEVSVQVGADIRKSEPVYQEGGWKVVASPSGMLRSGGVVYDYLYWDGIGRGVYTNLSDRGVVVSQNQVERTLRTQLGQLGLNIKEANDFMEFWLPKIPTTPYVRLTWLGTKEMNILAPLAIYPKPTTLVRVFLEYEGLDKSKKLKPQKLTGFVRSGFTVVEWGGLLLN